MRLNQAITGYVVTEFTDVHWECNGMLTMQRQPKHGLDPILKEINQDRVVLLRPSRWNGRPGEEIELLVSVVGIAGEEGDGFIQWEAGGQPAGSQPQARLSPSRLLAQAATRFQPAGWRRMAVN